MPASVSYGNAQGQEELAHLFDSDDDSPATVKSDAFRAGKPRRRRAIDSDTEENNESVGEEGIERKRKEERVKEREEREERDKEREEREGKSGNESVQRKRDKDDDQGGDPDNPKSEAKKKTSKAAKRPRLDEHMLMSEKGIPELMRQISTFGFRGPGHETSDLRQLLQIYRLWAHHLCYCYDFADFVLAAQKHGTRAIRRYLDRMTAEMSGK